MERWKREMFGVYASEQFPEDGAVAVFRDRGLAENWAAENGYEIIISTFVLATFNNDGVEK